MNFFPQPQIPDSLLHGMHEIITTKELDQKNGGQWRTAEEKRIPFRGVILPVTDKDLIRDASGTITNDMEKIYTNGHALSVGARVEDTGGSGCIYTVKQELDHNSLHPMKRYLVERKGRASQR